MGNTQITVNTTRARVGIAVNAKKPTMGVTVVRGESIPAYHGTYTVVPRLEDDQVLETNGKKMLDDVTVKGVDVHIVHDASGGLVYSID